MEGSMPSHPIRLYTRGIDLQQRFLAGYVRGGGRTRRCHSNLALVGERIGSGD